MSGEQSEHFGDIILFRQFLGVVPLIVFDA